MYNFIANFLLFASTFVKRLLNENNVLKDEIFYLTFCFCSELLFKKVVCSFVVSVLFCSFNSVCGAQATEFNAG